MTSDFPVISYMMGFPARQRRDAERERDERAYEGTWERNRIVSKLKAYQELATSIEYIQLAKDLLESIPYKELMERNRAAETLFRRALKNLDEICHFPSSPFYKKHQETF